MKADGRYVFLKFDEIVWVEAADNYVVIHTTAGERLMPRDTLSSIEARLGTQHFARVSRSALVRIDQVKELQPNSQGDYSILLRNGIRIRSAAACAGDSRNSWWRASARTAGRPMRRPAPQEQSKPHLAPR